MSIKREEVEHIAKLSRLSLSEDEKELFGSQLGRIIEYVKQLNGLDTTDVKPTSHVIDLKNVSRTDRNRRSLSNDDALGNAPERSGGHFRVPKIIE